MGESCLWTGWPDLGTDEPDFGTDKPFRGPGELCRHLDGRKTAFSVPGRPICRNTAFLRPRRDIASSDKLTPTKKAKQAGAVGAEMWVIIGDQAPTPTRSPTTCCGGRTRGGEASVE